MDSKCSQGETCKMVLPELGKVGKELKMKYEQSTCLKGPINVNRENQTRGELVCFNDSIDYCTANPDYGIAGVAGRECIMNDNHASSSHHCNNLCCDHGVEEFTVTTPCECKFIWCCYVVCESTCSKTKTRHRCKAKN